METTPEEIFRKRYLSTEQLMGHGIPFNRIDGWLSSGRIERIDRGVYCLPNTPKDDLALIQYRYDRSIFSGITALRIHGLSDHISESYHVTMPKGYNPASLRDCPWDLSITRSVPKLYGLGLTSAETEEGNTIRVYDKERSLCDILRGKGLPPFIVRTAMKRYFNNDDRNTELLREYAERLHVKERMMRYLEFF